MGASLARHATINLVGGAFVPAASFATGPILAHALSAHGRGELAAATMPLALIVMVATLGLPEAVTYFAARDRRKTFMLVRRGALLMLPPAAIGAAVLVLVSPWISGGSKTVHHIILLSAAVIAPSLFLCIIRAAAAAHNRWTAITLERVISATSRLIPLVILFVIGELDLVSAALVTIISTLVGAVAYLPFLTSRNSGPPVDTVAKRDILRFGAGVWFGSVSGIVLMRIDQVLLSPLSGAFQLGIYAVAVSISELPLIANAAIRETAFTHLSDHGVRSDEVGRLSRVSTLIVFALCLPVGLLAPIVVPSLYGHEFSSSVPVLFILLVAVLLGNPGSLAGVGLSSAGYPHLRSAALVAASIVNVVILFWLVPILGAIGAAIATLLGNLTSSNICIAWMMIKRNARLGDFYRIRRSDLVTVRDFLLRGIRAFTRKANTI